MPPRGGVPLKSSRKDVSTYVNVRQLATASAGVFLAEAESTKMNEMTKKVLCAVDDSEHSKIAVAVAGELAKATGAELTLLAVNAAIGYSSQRGDCLRVGGLGFEAHTGWRFGYR